MTLARKLLHEHERERQAWERERRRLIETICHLSGNPLPRHEPLNGDEPYDPWAGLQLIPDPDQLPD